jgi:flagellar hook-basal body protein
MTASSPNTPIVLGQLTLTNFANPQGLQTVADNRYRETSASGVSLTNIPGTNGLGVLTQGRLEQSNVDTSQEMVRLANTSRDYTVNSRAFKVEDQLVQGALSLIG